MRKWMKFKQVSLAFPAKGLVLVQGCNTASGGALQSVGSGKSGIGEAIGRTLLGAPGRFDSLKEFSTDEQGDLYVKLEADLLGRPLVVEYGYKCEELGGGGEALRYHYDGVTVERSKYDETRAELSRLLGVSPLLASWTALIDGDSVKFSKLRQSDAVDLVMASLRQPPWSTYHENSKKVLGAFRRSMVAVETTATLKAEAVTAAKNKWQEAAGALKQAQTAYAEALAKSSGRIQQLNTFVTAKREKIETAENEIKGLKKKLVKLEEEKAEKNHALEIKMHEIDDQLLAAEDARKPFDTARTNALTVVTNARTAYNNYKNAGKKCVTCQRPMGTVDPVRLQSLLEALEDAQQASTEASEAWTVAEQAVTTLNVAHRAAITEQRTISMQTTAEAHSDKIEELSSAIETTKESIHEAELEIAGLANGPSEAQVLTAETRMDDLFAEHATALAESKTAAEALAADQVTAKVLNYWNVALSPYGIPNMVLRNAIGPLNKEARRISATVTGSTINISFSTTKELASGLDKAQLNIVVDNKLGSKAVKGSSKGEGGLTNFVLSETLSEVGQVSRRVGFRFYDEVVPHQDPKVCRSIYAYMRNMAEQLGILVFLVDHNPLVANYADHVLLVEKIGEGDRVESVVSWR